MFFSVRTVLTFAANPIGAICLKAGWLAVGTAASVRESVADHYCIHPVVAAIYWLSLRNNSLLNSCAKLFGLCVFAVTNPGAAPDLGSDPLSAFTCGWGASAP